MSYFKSDDDVRIYYKLLNKNSKKNNTSKKTTVVFVHGWIANWTCFKREIEYFQNKGFPVLYLDLRGHGLSDKPKKKEKYHLDLMVSDLLGILNKEKIEKIDIVGHSMGGMISALFAYNYPEKLNSLIIVDSSYQNPLFSPQFSFFNKHRTFITHLCDYIINHTSTKHFKEFKEQEFDISNIKNRNDVMLFLELLFHTPIHSSLSCVEGMFNYNLKNKLKKITTPTLIIGSSKDQFFGKELEKYFSNHIHGAKLIIDNGTHFIIIKKPEEIANQINLFLDKVEKHNN